MQCPNCGYEHERKYLMATEQDGPSYFDMLRGDGDPWQVALARGGGLILLFVILTAVLALN